MNNKFMGYVGENGVFVAQSKSPALNILKPNVYELDYNERSDTLYFLEVNTNHDKLLDIPNSAYDKVVSEIQTFLKPESKQILSDFGFVYKRSTLLYGPPGTGKTCVVNRVSKLVKDANGIVLFNPHPKLLSKAFQQLEDIQPNTTILVIFEELDQLVMRYEAELLNLLDGEIQKPNIIYVATTNFIERIPARLRRPGRFSSLIEVGYPTKAARTFFLNEKFSQANYPITKEELTKWVNSTKGFSIDELTEVIRACACLKQDFDEVIKRVKTLRNLKQDEFNDETGKLIEKLETLDYEIPEDSQSYLQRQEQQQLAEALNNAMNSSINMNMVPKSYRAR